MANILRKVGNFFPNIGIVVTVGNLIYLIVHLGNLTPETLGQAIMVAFLATFISIAVSNLLFLPLATKLENRKTVKYGKSTKWSVRKL